MSASQLERSTVLHVASLSALSLSEEETAKMTKEIGAILKYVEELGTVDTTGVLPTRQVTPSGVLPGGRADLGQTAWRTDSVELGLSHEEALAQAPRVANDGFVVPGFVEG